MRWGVQQTGEPIAEGENRLALSEPSIYGAVVSANIYYAMLQAEVRKRRSPQDAGMAEATNVAPQADPGEKRERPQQQSREGDKDVDSKESAKSSLGQYFEWDRPLERTSFWLVLLFTILSLGTRFYHIAKGNFVVYCGWGALPLIRSSPATPL